MNGLNVWNKGVINEVQDEIVKIKKKRQIIGEEIDRYNYLLTPLIENDRQLLDEQLALEQYLRKKGVNVEGMVNHDSAE